MNEKERLDIEQADASRKLSSEELMNPIPNFYGGANHVTGEAVTDEKVTVEVKHRNPLKMVKRVAQGVYETPTNAKIYGAAAALEGTGAGLAHFQGHTIVTILMSLSSVMFAANTAITAKKKK